MIEEYAYASGAHNAGCIVSSTFFRRRVTTCLFLTANIIADDGGVVDIYQKQIILIEDGYVAHISANSYLGDNTDKLLYMVSYLNK